MREIKKIVNKRRFNFENKLSVILQKHSNPLQYLQTEIDNISLNIIDPVENMMNTIYKDILTRKLRHMIMQETFININKPICFNAE